MLPVAFVPNQEYLASEFLKIANTDNGNQFQPGTLLEIITRSLPDKKVSFVFHNWAKECIKNNVLHVGICGASLHGTGTIDHSFSVCSLHPPASDTYYSPKFAKPKEIHDGLVTIKYVSYNFLDTLLPNTPSTISELIRQYLYKH